MKRDSKAIRWLPVLLVLILPACGGQSPYVAKSYPVSGTIKVKGKPLDNAQVTLVSLDRADVGFMAMTDARGNFDVQAVPAGTYRVQVDRQSGDAVSDPRFAMYGAQSPLKIDVTAEQSDVQLDLDIASPM